MRVWIGIVAVAVAVMEMTGVVGAADLPDGVVGLKLGMRLDAVEKLFPAMEKAGELGKAQDDKLTVIGTIVRDQKIGPLEHCDLELRFLNDELFYIIVEYGHALMPRRVQQYLQQQYGPPKTIPPVWFTDKIAMSHNTQQRFFAIQDRGRYDLLHHALRQHEGWMAPLARMVLPTLQPKPRTFVKSKIQFGPSSAVTVGGKGNFAVAVADFNQDGKQDLVVSGHADAKLWTLKGKGDGTFEPAVAVSVGPTPRGLTTGDFNGDGRPDVAVATMDDGSVWVFLTQPDGTLGKGTAYKCAVNPFTVVAGDLNGDGKPDLVVSDESNLLPKFEKIPGTVSVLLNDGSGKFGKSKELNAHKFPAGMALADLDSDGSLDLMVANWGSQDLSYFRGTGKGSFADAVSIPYDGATAYPVIVATLMKEQAPSVITAEMGHSSVQTFQRSADGKFVDRLQAEVNAGARSLAAADFDGDGTIDLVTANSTSGTVSVLVVQKDGDLGVTVEPQAGSKPNWVAVGDFNNDGRPDLVLAQLELPSVAVLLNETPK